MFRKKQNNQTISSVRQRRPQQRSGEAFRRNSVVISHRQKEIAARQQSVTQRQMEQKKQASRRKSRNRVIVVLVLAILALGIHRMNLSRVSVTSNASSKLTAEQRLLYEDAILQSYRSHTLAGQWWLADTTALSFALLKQFPEIEHISFSSKIPLSSELQTDIRFRKAVFSWKDSNGSQLLVDKSGVLFTKNLDPSVNTSKLIKIEDQSGIVIDSGEAALSSSAVQFIGQLHTKLPPLYGGAPITKVVIPQSTREVQVQVKDIKYNIKFSTSRDVDAQIGELGSLLPYLKSKNVNPNEYIDIRLEHKVFYK